MITLYTVLRYEYISIPVNIEFMLLKFCVLLYQNLFIYIYIYVKILVKQNTKFKQHKFNFYRYGNVFIA